MWKVRLTRLSWIWIFLHLHVALMPGLRCFICKTVNMSDWLWCLPEEVPTQADHCILGCVQTDITLESAVLVATVGRSRAARARTWVICGRGRARGWRGGSGCHLKTDPQNRKVQVGWLRWHPAHQNGYIRRPNGRGFVASKEEETRNWAGHK